MKTQDLQKKIIYHIGMPRTGSSFLYAQLSKHPEIYAPPIKELNYFNKHSDKSLAWYYNFFKELTDEKVAIDFSPAYFQQKECLQKILDLNPKSRFILGIRRPSEFALSHFKHCQLLATRKKSFEDFLNSGIDVMEPGLGVIRVTPILPEIITNHLQYYLKELGGQLFFYSYELLEENPLELLSRIEKFLEISPYFNEENFENRKINSSNRTRSKWLNYIKSKPFIYRSALALIPHKILNASYNKIASFSVKNVKAPVTSEESLRDLKFAQDFYRKADEFYDVIFEKNFLYHTAIKEHPLSL